MNERSRRRTGFNQKLDSNKSQERNYSSSRKHKPDYWVLVLSALLMTVGLVVVYSISPGLAASQHISQSYFITKQIIDIALGVVAFAIAAYLPTKVWLKVALPLLATAAVASLIVVFTPIDEVYRAHRWIRIGGTSFQVVELIKLAVLVWAAGFLAERWRRGELANFRSTTRPLLVLLLVVGIVVAGLQSDLGSAGVIVGMLGLMAFSVGIPLKRILTIGSVILLVGILSVSTTSYRRDRLASFINPEKDCQTTSYQACQALISVGSGGVFGLGLGYSVQAYGYLPEASNDSIFAIIAEKFGFIGSISIIAIYGVIITRLKNIAERTADQFSRLLVIGVLAWLSSQMIINVGAMLGLLPLKGITLPFISQGGTSLIFLTTALGMVYQISRYTSYNVTEPSRSLTEKSNAYHSFDGRGIRRSHNPSLVTRPRT